MKKNSVATISIVGRSKTGKTTLIEKLLPVLQGQGLRVAVIKHHHGDFDIDREGKDTYRYKKAGAATVVISSPAKIGIVCDTGEDLTVEKITGRYIYDVDIIITEGYKAERLPKIEVLPWKEGIEPACLNDRSLIAVVTDRYIDAPVPQFMRDDIRGIADFITKFIVSC